MYNRFMNKNPTTPLTEQQQEILIILQEECAEVSQEISKIFRFGIDETHKSGIPHRLVLEEEVGDLLCMIDLLVEKGVVDRSNLEEAKINKQLKLKKWSSIYD